jgi:hypothetical protein
MKFCHSHVSGWKLENIILNEVSQAQKAKSDILSHMWNIDLKQMKQYYEILVTLGEVTYERGWVKEGN